MIAPLGDGLFRLTSFINHQRVDTLLDSGSALNCIDQAFAARLGLRGRLLRVPLPVRFGNGSQASITHTVTVRLQLAGGTSTRMTLRVVPNLPVADVIFGAPWLRHHNPRIDWKANFLTLQGRKIPFQPREGIVSVKKDVAVTWSATLEDPTPCPKGDIAFSQAPCLREVGEGSYDVHRPTHWEGNAVMPVDYSLGDPPSYNDFAKLINELPPQDTPQARNLLNKFKHLFPDELPHILPPTKG